MGDQTKRELLREMGKEEVEAAKEEDEVGKMMGDQKESKVLLGLDEDDDGSVEEDDDKSAEEEDDGSAEEEDEPVEQEDVLANAAEAGSPQPGAAGGRRKGAETYAA